MRKRRQRAHGSNTVVDAKRTRLGVTDRKVAAPDLCGQVVNDYLVEAELGSGAMGTVYLASHIDTHRRVAIKTLHSHLVSEPAIVRRFRREAKVASRLSHPNVGGVIELGSVLEDGRHVIVLELVEGEPLSTLLTMPLPPERALDLVGQILRGLEHAHAAGLVHRDLKPDNVLVEWRDGRDHARIIDFGIAFVRDPEDGAVERLTADGQLIGTPMYMSPEQARGDAVDHRADLFAAGVMLYEMLAGVLPFQGRPLQMLQASLHREPPPIAERVPGLLVDPLHEALARKLMARDLRVRFASARAALDALALIANDPEAAGPAVGVMNVTRALGAISLPEPPPAPSPKKRR